MKISLLFFICLLNFQAANGFDIKFVNAAASSLLVAPAIYLIVTALLKLCGENRGAPALIENDEVL